MVENKTQKVYQSSTLSLLSHNTFPEFMEIHHLNLLFTVTTECHRLVFYI